MRIRRVWLEVRVQTRRVRHPSGGEQARSARRGRSTSRGGGRGPAPARFGSVPCLVTLPRRYSVRLCGTCHGVWWWVAVYLAKEHESKDADQDARHERVCKEITSAQVEDGVHGWLNAGSGARGAVSLFGCCVLRSMFRGIIDFRARLLLSTSTSSGEYCGRACVRAQPHLFLYLCSSLWSIKKQQNERAGRGGAGCPGLHAQNCKAPRATRDVRRRTRELELRPTEAMAAALVMHPTMADGWGADQQY